MSVKPWVYFQIWENAWAGFPKDKGQPRKRWREIDEGVARPVGDLIRTIAPITRQAVIWGLK